MSEFDPAIDALIETLRTQQLENPDQGFLWLVDEHPINPFKLVSLEKRSLFFISNRWDQYLLAQSRGISAEFTDFRINETLKPQGIFIRVPKERALVHYLINQSFQVLSKGGRLWLFGYKNEGIKTHIGRAAKLFGDQPDTSKGKNQLSIACMEKCTNENSFLDDNRYGSLRQIAIDQFNFWSKPGIYGWDKIDPGSKLLSDSLTGHSDAKKGIRVLDIGCGYGYLSLWATSLKPSHLTATDNSCGALEATQKNLESTNSEVLASDAADCIEGQYDLILCNPPFHRGFTTTAELHQRFLSNTRRLLAPKGSAWFVVNQFLNVEKKALQFGMLTEEITRSDGFKVLRLKRQEAA